MKWLSARLHAGDWTPGAHNVALLVVQMIVCAQSALRGFDYLQRQPPTAALGAVEALFPLTVWGTALLAATALVLVGLAGRWAPPVMAGHALVGSIYIGIGIGLLVTNGEPVGALALLGLLVALAGATFVIRDYAPTAVRILAGVPVMLLGQWLMSIDLGAGYRTGTSLMGGGLIHWVLGLGTLVLWIRQHVTVQVAEERAARDLR